MSASQSLIAGDVLDAYPLRAHRRLLDVGGGEGAFVIEAASSARRTCTSRCSICRPLPSAPEVDSPTRRLPSRTTVASGDFFHDALPDGADVVTLVRVIHDHDDAAVLALLRNIRRALPPDGVLLIAEPMSGRPVPKRSADAYFGFYLLAMGQRPCANVRTKSAGCLQAAGFDDPPVLLTTRRPMLVSAMVATPSLQK